METFENNPAENINSPEFKNSFQEVVMLLKPGAAQFEQGIYEFCDKNGLTVIGRNQLKFDEEKIKEFYPKSIGRSWLEPMKEYFAQDEVVALMVEGPNAMNILNDLKRRFRGIMNLKVPEDRFHVSDSVSETERERKVVGFDNTVPNQSIHQNIDLGNR